MRRLREGDLVILRPYQELAVQAPFEYFTKKRGNPILALPTGSGKSVIIAEFVKRALKIYPMTRVLMLTHVKELIEQNFIKLLTLWPTAPAGIYSAGIGRRDVGFPITFAGIASVARKPELFGRIDLVIIDECHLVSHKEETMYVSFIDALMKANPYLKVIGLTATPYRLGLGLLTEGDVFTDICYDLTTREAFNKLIEDGYLCKLVPRHTRAELDVSDVKKQGGEFIQKDLQQAVDKASLTEAAINECLEVASERKHWLVFATGIEHAHHIAGTLNDKGIKAAVVHGELDKQTRAKILADYKSGVYRAVVNYGVLTTGFDFPGMDLIVMLRPTSSPGLWVQMLGRGTRPAEGKENCLVLDFARNTLRLGPINDPVLPKARGEKSEPGVAPVRLCQGCGAYAHASARVCPECGMEFPAAPTKLTGSASSLALIAQDIPEVVEFKVDMVTYAVHHKDGRPPSMRISYQCGIRMFSEYFHFELPGLPKVKTTKWWARRSQAPVPETTANAILMSSYLMQPKTIKVWINKKHPEVMSYAF